MLDLALVLFSQRKLIGKAPLFSTSSRGKHTLARFEAIGMDEELAEDYDKLLTILDDTIKQQREHTLAMLG